MGSPKEECKFDSRGSSGFGASLQDNQADGIGGVKGSSETLCQTIKSRVDSQLEQVDVRSLPSLPLSWRKAFPKTAAIYFVLSKDETLLYIGRSNDFNSRWKQHHKLKELEKLGDLRVAWLEVSNSVLLPEIEYALIKHFKPALNGFNNALTPTRCGKDEARIHTVKVRLNNQELSRLQEEAQRREITVSEVFRDLIKMLGKEEAKSA